MADIVKSTNLNAPEFTHEIIVPADVAPIKQKSRGVPFIFQEEFKQMVLEMKAAGMVVDSKSPQSA